MILITAQNVDTSVMLDYELEVIDATMPDTQDYLFDVEYWSHPYNQGKALFALLALCLQGCLHTNLHAPCMPLHPL